jgi:aspartyl-tRNA synthetase
MGEALKGLKRTIMCGNLRDINAGENAVVMGWVQRKRNKGGIIFVDIRDRSGILQVVFEEKINKEAFEKADTLKPEYCIAVCGGRNCSNAANAMIFGVCP